MLPRIVIKHWTENEDINHSLFRGVSSKTSHKMYLIPLKNVFNKFEYAVPVLDQDVIFRHTSRTDNTKCLSALRKGNVLPADVGKNVPSVKILFKKKCSDVLCDLYTGAIKRLSKIAFSLFNFS